MTRKEAIKHIKDIICENNTVKHSDMVVFENEKEALRMAIQALSQEPCDDAISREWLMRKATERFYTTNYFNHISAMIEEAPSVTQKSWHWISHREHCENLGVMPSGLGAYEWCSNCDCGIDVRE